MSFRRGKSSTEDTVVAPEVELHSDATAQMEKDKPASKEKATKDKGETNKGRRRLRLLLFTFVVLVAAFVGLLKVAYVAQKPGQTLGLDEIYRLAEGNRLKSVKLLDEHAMIVGEKCLAAPSELAAPGRRPPRCYDPVTSSFHVSYPASQVATQQLLEAIRRSSGAAIDVDSQTEVKVAKLLATFVVPLLMLANLFGLIFFANTGEGTISEVAGFGRFGRKRQRSKLGTGVTFAQVAGADEAVAELREVIDYLTNPGRFQALGAAPPKGVLLFGPPGCGKTLLARATAGESGVPFFSASGTEFVESLVGVGAARVRDLFRQVREVAPAILFIDEIDAVGRRRSGEGTSGGEREQTLNQLLVELDGFEVSSGIVLMGATNRPDILDPALMRPGRFDRHITLEPPDLHGREAILDVHSKGRPFAPDVDLTLLARRTPGFTGADLANVINEASLLAIRVGEAEIKMAHVSEAVLRVLHGPQRRGRILAPEEGKRLAVHEAGHAIVAAAFGRANEVHRVSIVGRGRALGQSSATGEERTVLTTSEMQSRLAMAMAGVAAERRVCGEASTTAEEDVARATSLAREMVGLYGMSEELGPVRVLSRASGFLGSDTALDMVAGPTMAEFDRAVRRLIVEGEARAASVIDARVSLLEEMAEALQREETLEGADLAAFLGRVGAASDGGAPARSAPSRGRR